MRKILVALPEELIVEVEEGAKRSLMYRSEYIRHVLQKHVSGKYPEVIERLSREDMTRFADLDDS